MRRIVQRRRCIFSPSSSARTSRADAYVRYVPQTRAVITGSADGRKIIDRILRICECKPLTFCLFSPRPSVRIDPTLAPRPGGADGGPAELLLRVKFLGGA